MRTRRPRSADAAEERILDALLPPPRHESFERRENGESATRQTFRKKLREGELDERRSRSSCRCRAVGVEIMAPPGMEEMTSQLQGLFPTCQRPARRAAQVAEARSSCVEEEASRLINEEEVKARAVEAVEQNGIVFIDELDKVASRPKPGRRRLARGRAARPAAADRRLHRQHQATAWCAPTTCCSSPRARSISPSPPT
jgi:ATP-dependent HslUV protease ATP-binding subunit HslU